MKHVFKFLAVILAVGLFSFPVHAATPDDAKAYATKVGDEVLAILDNASLDKPAKLKTLESLFVDVVDVNWVGRFVLGQYWRQASAEQQAAYIDAYGAFLVKNYTSNFAQYGGERFAVTASREDRPGEFFVRTEIQRKNGQPPVIVDYRLRADDKNTFKVFDIIVEGVSLISTQRSEFASVVSRQGLDTLVSLLKRKTLKLEEQMQEMVLSNKGA